MRTDELAIEYPRDHDVSDEGSRALRDAEDVFKLCVRLIKGR